MSDIKELRKRAMYDPQSLTQEEWNAIHKAATSVPKKDFYDEDFKVSSKQKKFQKEWGW